MTILKLILKYTDLLVSVTEQINRPQSVIFYKDDENRFKTRFTLKLKTCSAYVITIEIKPSLQMSYMKLGSTKYDQPSSKSNSSEEGKCLYKFNWSTEGIDITERKYRTIVPCAIKFRGYKELNFKLSVKFYGCEKNIHYNGIPFTSVCLDGVLVNNKESRGHLFHVIFT